MCPERTRTEVAHPTRFERVTFAFGGQRSIQLSYGCVTVHLADWPGLGNGPARALRKCSEDRIFRSKSLDCLANSRRLGHAGGTRAARVKQPPHLRTRLGGAEQVALHL